MWKILESCGVFIVNELVGGDIVIVWIKFVDQWYEDGLGFIFVGCYFILVYLVPDEDWVLGFYFVWMA